MENTKGNRSQHGTCSKHWIAH